MDNIRCRYGRDNGHPKNTLVTCQEDDTIYFGVSRCNPNPSPKSGKKDAFRKDIGRMIALGRMDKAREEGENGGYMQDGNIRRHFSGLRGYVKVNHIEDLLSYFEDIDYYLEQ